MDNQKHSPKTADGQYQKTHQTETVDWQKKAEEYLLGWQRERANFENYKKDEDKRRREAAEFISAALMAEILPFYGQMKIAFKHVPADQEKSGWVVGLKHVQKQFTELLKKHKIEEIKTVGEKFDPNYHEAVASEIKEGFKEGVIFEETAAGYLLDERVLMPARVKVAK